MAAAAVLIPGSTSAHMKVNVAATFGQKISPVWAYFTKLHRRFRPRDESGQERHAACVAETARGVVCIPTMVPRLCTKHHIILCTRGDLPEMHCTNVAVFGR